MGIKELFIKLDFWIREEIKNKRKDFLELHKNWDSENEPNINAGKTNWMQRNALLTVNIRQSESKTWEERKLMSLPQISKNSGTH